MSVKPVAEAIEAIRATMHEADKALIERERFHEDARDLRAEYDDRIEFYVERAFVQTLILFESEKLDRTYAAVQELDREAKKNVSVL